MCWWHRQTDLEVQLARQASPADRVALSTVTIDFYSPGDAPSSDPDRTIISSFADGWSSFVAAMRFLGSLVAATRPYLVPSWCCASLSSFRGGLAGRRLNDLRPPVLIKTEDPQRCFRCLEDNIGLMV